MNIRQRTASEIKRLMQRRGVSQAELARRIDKPRSTINRWLSGRANLTLDTLVRIGLALGCELNAHRLLSPPVDYHRAIRDGLCIAA